MNKFGSVTPGFNVFFLFRIPKGGGREGIWGKGIIWFVPALHSPPPSMHYYLQVRLTTSNEYLSNACMHAPCAEISTWAGWLSDKLWEFCFIFLGGGFFFSKRRLGNDDASSLDRIFFEKEKKKF